MVAFSLLVVVGTVFLARRLADLAALRDNVEAIEHREWIARMREVDRKLEEQKAANIRLLVTLHGCVEVFTPEPTAYAVSHDTPPALDRASVEAWLEAS